jgi:hypothetical protein
MSQQIPTTVELKNTIIAQFEAYFGQTIPVFVRAFLRVVSAVLAGLLVILYKYGGFIFLQQFVQYASFSTVVINGKSVVPLIEWGRLVGAADPTEATRAEMVVDVTVTNQTGSLPKNSQLTNVNNGVTYLTLAAVPVTAATVQATIRAYADTPRSHLSLPRRPMLRLRQPIVSGYLTGFENNHRVARTLITSCGARRSRGLSTPTRTPGTQGSLICTPRRRWPARARRTASRRPHSSRRCSPL